MLLDAAPRPLLAHDERHDEQDEEDEDEELGDPGGVAGDAAEPEHRRDDRHDEEDDRVPEHGAFPSKRRASGTAPRPNWARASRAPRIVTGRRAGRNRGFYAPSGISGSTSFASWPS